MFSKDFNLLLLSGKKKVFVKKHVTFLLDTTICNCNAKHSWDKTNKIIDKIGLKTGFHNISGLLQIVRKNKTCILQTSTIADFLFQKYGPGGIRQVDLLSNGLVKSSIISPMILITDHLNSGMYELCIDRVRLNHQT